MHRDTHVNNYTQEELFTEMKTMYQSERRFSIKPDANFDVSIRIAIKNQPGNEENEEKCQRSNMIYEKECNYWFKSQRL